MSIKTTCPHCNTPFNLGDEVRGRKVLCRACSEPFTVPDDEPGLLPLSMELDGPPPQAILVPSEECPVCGTRVPLDGSIGDITCPLCKDKVRRPRAAAGQDEALETYALEQPAVPPKSEGTNDRPRRPRQDEEEGPDRPRRRRRRDEEEREGPVRGDEKKLSPFQWAYLGISLHYVRILGILLSFLLGFVALLLVPISGALAGTVASLGMVVGVGSGVLGVLGSVLCLWGPPKANALPLLIVTLGVDGVVAACRLLGLFLVFLTLFGAPTGAAATGLDGVGLLGLGIGLILFLFYVWHLTSRLGEGSLANEAGGVLLELAILVGGLIGAAFVAAFLLMVLRAAPGSPPAVLLQLAVGIGFMVFMLKWWLRLALLLASLRQALLSCCEGRERGLPRWARIVDGLIPTPR